MSLSKLPKFSLLAVGFLLLGFQLARAVPPAKDAPPPAKAAQPAAKAAPPAPAESLDIRYARAQVALAEANVKRLQQMNQKVANSVSADTLVSFQRDLAVAQAELQAALAGDPALQFDAWLRRAEAAVAYSEINWRGAVAANARVAGVINPTDVERRRLRLELNRLELERGEALVHATAEQKLTWQLSLITNELQQLKDEVRQTVPTAPIYPTWYGY